MPPVLLEPLVQPGLLGQMEPLVRQDCLAPQVNFTSTQTNRVIDYYALQSVCKHVLLKRKILPKTKIIIEDLCK